MFTIEDVAIRMAKLYYIRDEVWAGLEKTSVNYETVLELNYEILEAIYM